MPTRDPIIRMNLSSFQTELVQSWGLGHLSPRLKGSSLFDFNDKCLFIYRCGTSYVVRVSANQQGKNQEFKARFL